MSETPIQEIQRLARERDHRLDPKLLDGSRPLHGLQETAILRHLRSRPLREGVTEQPVSRETAPAPDIPPTMRAYSSMPEGFYATPSRTGTNDLDFWKVQRPSKGKWAGVTFVKRVLGGPANEDGLRTEQVSSMQQRLAARAITETGLDEAQALFADNMRRCIDCGTPLTDEISRRERRGPTCRGKRR